MNEQSSLTIRQAGPEDVDALAEVARQTFVETFATQNTPADMEAYVRRAFNLGAIAGELADTHSVFLVAEIGSRTAGYAKLFAGPGPACLTGARPVELNRLYVLAQFHGRGFGGKLMENSIDLARRAVYRTLWLGVWEHNERAKAFYRRWGFKVVGSHVFRLGTDDQTDLIMALSLT
jgi:ribosomal protein S18 acetylase RimI-like enzyme